MTKNFKKKTKNLLNNLRPKIYLASMAERNLSTRPVYKYSKDHQLFNKTLATFIDWYIFIEIVVTFIGMLILLEYGTNPVFFDFFKGHEWLQWLFSSLPEDPDLRRNCLILLLFATSLLRWQIFRFLRRFHRIAYEMATESEEHAEFVTTIVLLIVILIISFFLWLDFLNMPYIQSLWGYHVNHEIIISNGFWGEVRLPLQYGQMVYHYHKIVAIVKEIHPEVTPRALGMFMKWSKDNMIPMFHLYDAGGSAVADPQIFLILNSKLEAFQQLPPEVIVQQPWYQWVYENLNPFKAFAKHLKDYSEAEMFRLRGGPRRY